MRIVTPARSEIAAIQHRESAFYWSNCAAGLARKHGILQVFDARIGANGRASNIATRGTDLSGDEIRDVSVFEGPIHSKVLKELAISATMQKAEVLYLFDADLRPLGKLNYPAISTRVIPPLNRAAPFEPADPQAWQCDDERWNNRTIRYQQLDAGTPWTCIAYAGVKKTRPEWPIAVSDGRRVVLGAPLLDLVCCAQSFPPLTESFYTDEQSDRLFEIEKWLVAQFLKHCAAAGKSVVRILEWPARFTSALTVRHDYDRTIADEDWDSLLAFYDGLGIRASMGFPVKTVNGLQMIAAAARGHEINVHSEAADAGGFHAEVRCISAASESVPVGMTAHGGHGAAGFLGDVQYGWLEDFGMLWTEMLRRRTGLPFAVNRITDDAPRPSGLVAFPWHYSLDTGTSADAHRAAELEETIPSLLADRRHVTLMNHPDIHVDELKKLISGFDLAATWCATFREVAEWTKVAKLDSAAVLDEDGSVRIRFPRRLPAAAIVQHLSAQGATKEIECEESCQEIRIPIS